jgi:hypothetical protein
MEPLDQRDHLSVKYIPEILANYSLQAADLA